VNASNNPSPTVGRLARADGGFDQQRRTHIELVQVVIR
jgi:hypothetical protein